LAAVLTHGAAIAHAQQEPQEQAPSPPPQQPQPEPQPERPYPSPRQPDPFEQRRAEEFDRQERERTLLMLGAFGADATAADRMRRSSQPHFAPVMQHDPEFSLESIPLQQWLSTKDTAEIPWKIEVKDPALRMDQRLEVAYTARIQAKHLNNLGAPRELLFIMGVNSPDGERMVLPKVVRQTIKGNLPDNVELWFSDWVFTRPGDYFLWFVLYDRETGKHNAAKRHVQVSRLEDDAFPDSSNGLPQVELPRLSDRDGGSIAGFYGGLAFPVRNKQKVRVEVISVLSPPEQWAGQKSILRSHNEHISAVTNMLSQLRLGSGSLSLTGLDVIRREIPFRQTHSEQIDWNDFTQALQKANNETVSTETLLGSKSGGIFFRNSLAQHLTDPGGERRVVIVVASRSMFPRGSDLQPLKIAAADCHCRLYHLRFRHDVRDNFDDIEKIIKPLRPKTFNVDTPSDLRKALATIINELETF
jgi:hypothetical protein